MIYGPNRLLADLLEQGYDAKIREAEGNKFVVIAYDVPIGRFVDRKIELGILSTPDYPRTVASAIHVKAEPQLLEKSDSQQNVRNIQDSALGTEWRYWSHNFQWTEERSTRRLISQINGIFKDA